VTKQPPTLLTREVEKTHIHTIFTEMKINKAAN
jgi:hypothetical protein